MARVPVFRSDRLSKSIKNPRANAGSFGASVGAGLQNLGAGTFQLAEKLYANEMKRLAVEQAEQEKSRQQAQESRGRVSDVLEVLSKNYKRSDVVESGLDIIATETRAQAEASGFPEVQVEEAVLAAQTDAMAIVAKLHVQDAEQQIRENPSLAIAQLESGEYQSLAPEKREQLKESAEAHTKTRTLLTAEQEAQKSRTVQAQVAEDSRNIRQGKIIEVQPELEANAKQSSQEPIVAANKRASENLRPFMAMSPPKLESIIEGIETGNVSESEREIVDRLVVSLGDGFVAEYQDVLATVLAGIPDGREGEFGDQLKDTPFGIVLEEAIRLRDTGQLETPDIDDIRNVIEAFSEGGFNKTIGEQLVFKALKTLEAESMTRARVNLADELLRRDQASGEFQKLLGDVVFTDENSLRERREIIDRQAEAYGIKDPKYIDTAARQILKRQWGDAANASVRLDMMTAMFDVFGRDSTQLILERAGILGNDVKAITMVLGRSRNVAEDLLVGLRVKELGNYKSLPEVVYSGFLNKFMKDMRAVGIAEPLLYRRLFELKFNQVELESDVDISDLARKFPDVPIGKTKLPIGEIVADGLDVIFDEFWISEIVGESHRVGNEKVRIPDRIGFDIFNEAFNGLQESDLITGGEFLRLTNGQPVTMDDIQKF